MCVDIWSFQSCYFLLFKCEHPVVGHAAAAALQGSEHVLTCHRSTEETSLLSAPKTQRGINIRQNEASPGSSVLFYVCFAFSPPTSCSCFRCTEEVTPAEGAQVRFAGRFKLVIIRKLFLRKIFFPLSLIWQRLFWQIEFIRTFLMV